MADGDHASYATALGIRKRVRRIEYRGGSRFITFSCYRRLPLFSNPAIADAFLNEIQQTRTEHGFAMFAYVIMPEHVHLLLAQYTRANAPAVGASLTRMKKPFAQEVIRRWRALNAPILSRLVAENGATRRRMDRFRRRTRDP